MIGTPEIAQSRASPVAPRRHSSVSATVPVSIAMALKRSKAPCRPTGRSRPSPADHIRLGSAECFDERLVHRDEHEVARPQEDGRRGRGSERFLETLLTLAKRILGLFLTFEVGEGKQHAGLVPNLQRLAGDDHPFRAAIRQIQTRFIWGSSRRGSSARSRADAFPRP